MLELDASRKNLLLNDSVAPPALVWVLAATEWRLQIQVLIRGIGDIAAAAATATAAAAKIKLSGGGGKHREKVLGATFIINRVSFALVVAAYRPTF